MLRSRSRLWVAVAAISLIFCGDALAQTANRARTTSDEVQSPKARTAYAEWRRLSQNEVNCVDRSLRGQRSTLWFLIQQGIGPSDAVVARFRTACRAQAKVSDRSTVVYNGSQALAASVGPAAAKAVSDKAAADKTARDRAESDKMAADWNRAVAIQAAATQAAATKAAADKAAADKAATDKAAADKATVVRVAVDTAAADDVAAGPAATGEVAENPTKPETERTQADAVSAPAGVERPQQGTEKISADAALAYSMAESRISFVSGLVSGPIIFILGGVMFLFLSSKRRTPAVRPESVASSLASVGSRSEFDRVVAAVLAELKRRETRQPTPVPSEREPRTDEVLVH